MKLADLIPSSEAMAGFRDIEQQLQSRRYRSRWALIGTAVLFIGQIALKLKWPELPNSFSLDAIGAFVASPAVVAAGFTAVGACLWILWGYTGFLFKQSQEPFRYTFSISEFGIASNPCERLQVDQKLLRHDLIERLNRRVRRFSLLENPKTEETAHGTKDVKTTSHLHIEGDCAIRRDATEGWFVHVWPRVRIGPEGNPFTLAYPVRLPTENGDAPGDDKTKVSLNPDAYERLVERVYSSITTEIYKKIEIDLRDKMTLFPTSSLRALARYIEAEDFETSNTIEAYDRALEMYRTSLEELQDSWLHRWRVGLRGHTLVSLPLLGVRVSMEAEAKAKLGYARCLIYRRIVSEMAGRQRNPLFESRRKLSEARELLRQCYNSFLQRARLEVPANCDTSWTSRIAIATSTIRGPMWYKQLYERICEENCETYAVSALAHSLLGDPKEAERLLALADAFAECGNLEGRPPGRARLLFFVAKAELEPTLEQKLVYLNQAKELDPESEIVLYRLAYVSDLLARDQGEITAEKAKYLNGKYDAVLKVNPANIASLIGQGYLLWLTDNLEQAEKKLQAGIELQKIVTQTFVGDLKYCLARVEVERTVQQLRRASDFSEDSQKKAIRQLNQAAFDYEEATAADPSVAAAFGDAQGKSRNNYYEFINRQILARYKLLAGRALKLQILLFKRKANLGEDQLVNSLVSCALNDYGNACLNYHLRFEVGIGKDATLKMALRHFEKSCEMFASNLMAEYNLFCALTWENDDEACKRAERLRKSDKLSPTALASVLTRVFRDSRYEISRIDLEGDNLKSEEGPLKQQIEALLSPGAVHDGQGIGNSEGMLPEKQRRLAFIKKRISEIDDRRKSIEEEMELSRESILRHANRTGLAPFANYLKIEKIRDVLARGFQSSFGDMEVSILIALARIWAVQPGCEKGSRELCEYILKFYYPEHFDVSQTILSLLDLKHEKRKILSEQREEAIRLALRSDPKSYFYKMLLLYQGDDSVASACKDWPDGFSWDANYQKAITLYNELKKDCADFPAFHNSLAFAHQCRGNQAFELLAEGSSSKETEDDLKKRAAESGEAALRERRVACRLDPKNGEYRGNLLTSTGRQLITGNIWQDPLADRRAVTLVKVEFSQDSIGDLGMTGSALPEGLQKKITDVRTDLKYNHGFSLPGITFYDDKNIERGKFRFVIRGVPLPLLQHGSDPDQEKQWGELKWRIEKMAISNAARLFTSDACYTELSEIINLDKLTEPEKGEYTGIQAEPDPLFALTAVLKMLLREQVPIAEFVVIVREFIRCRRLGLDLLRTVEEIRSLPQIRVKLPGNSTGSSVKRIWRLNQDLEDRVYSAIDWNWSAPIFNNSLDIRWKVRSLAADVKRQAGNDSTLLTSAEVRPFVRKLVEVLALLFAPVPEIQLFFASCPDGDPGRLLRRQLRIRGCIFI